MSLMRRSLLKASQSQWLREHAPRYGFMKRTVTRFMPGENVDDALAAAQTLASSGVGTVLTHLGENITDRAEAEEVTKHYLDLLDRIRDAKLPAEVSVKLTQLGLDLDREFCYSNLVGLIEHTSAEKRRMSGCFTVRSSMHRLSLPPHREQTLRRPDVHDAL